MCSGGFAKCLGITLMPLSIVCVLCNILLFLPGGKSVESKYITDEVWYFGGILGSGVLMIFPALVFLGLKNNDCCGCCGNESCGRRFAMLSSILFAAVGVMGAGYSVIVSAVAINHGPKCLAQVNSTEQWVYPFSNGNSAAGNPQTKAGLPTVLQSFRSPEGFIFSDYLSNQTYWERCLEPVDVVHWHISMFSILLVVGIIQMALCAVQVVNGLLGALCGGCCGCCGGSDGAV